MKPSIINQGLYLYYYYYYYYFSK